MRSEVRRQTCPSAFCLVAPFLPNRDLPIGKECGLAEFAASYRFFLAVLQRPLSLAIPSLVESQRSSSRERPQPPGLSLPALRLVEEYVCNWYTFRRGKLQDHSVLSTETA